MPAQQQSILNNLYGNNIWRGFEPKSFEANVEGWNGNHPSLARLIQSSGPKVVIDVGVWKGQSTITMASELKRREIDGCVIAVDTFLGSPEHWRGEFFTRRHGMPDLYEIFMSNVVRAGVQDFVIPFPQTSITAAKILRAHGIVASVVHIDAAHEYEEVIRDATEYWELLGPGGSLIGDDYHSSWPGVVRAAGEFSAARLLPLRIEAPKWIVERPA